MKQVFDRYALNIFVALMLFVGVFIISPGIDIYGLNRNIYAFIIFSFLFTLLCLNIRRVYGFYYFFSFGIVALSFLPILRWGIDLKHGFIVVLPLISLLLLLVSKRQEIEIFVKVASFILFFIIIGSYVGFIGYIFLDVKPLVFEYISNKSIFWFGTTFASYSYGGNIRPAGIYDEPGALSFVICTIVLARSVMGLNEKVSWVLLILGFITFSLAHLVFVFIYLLKDLNSHKKYMIYMITFACLYFIYNYAIHETALGESLELLISGRIEYDEQYMFKGNNRGIRFANALKYLNLDVFLFGLDGRLFYNYYESSKEYMVFGENALSPIIVRGIFSSLLFYLVIIVLCYYILKGRKYFVLVGLLLLITQRPYVINSMGYSFLIFIPLVIYYKNAIEVKYDSLSKK